MNKVRSNEIGREFMNGREAKCSSAWTDGTKLVSYNTCVAFHDGVYTFRDEGGYSNTTRKHLSGVRGIAIDCPFQYGNPEPTISYADMWADVVSKLVILKGKQARARNTDYTDEISHYEAAAAYLLTIC